MTDRSNTPFAGPSLPCDPAWRDCRDTPFAFPVGGVSSLRAPARPIGTPDGGGASTSSTGTSTRDAAADALRMIDRIEAQTRELQRIAEEMPDILAHIEAGRCCSRNGNNTNASASANEPEDDPPSAA
jgi:hypothetical protein